MKIVTALLCMLPVVSGFSQVSKKIVISIYSCLFLYVRSHLNNFFLEQESTRRDALKSAAAAGVAFLPAAAFAAAGESPRFSVFGLLGDGSSLSEGAAYGTDQASPLYSPYSVYGDSTDKSLYKPGSTEYTTRAKKVLAESKKRLTKLPSYVDKKAWWEVSAELDRYMYETRGAVRSLATTPAQKKAATEFFKTIEKTDIAARRKLQAECAAASKDSVAKLDAFVALL